MRVIKSVRRIMLLPPDVSEYFCDGSRLYKDQCTG
jgi:hypothetical protein